MKPIPTDLSIKYIKTKAVQKVSYNENERAQDARRFADEITTINPFSFWPAHAHTATIILMRKIRSIVSFEGGWCRLNEQVIK